MRQRIQLFSLLILVGLIVYLSFNPSQVQMLMFAPPAAPQYSMTAISELKATQQTAPLQPQMKKPARMKMRATPSPTPREDLLTELERAYDSDDVCRYITLSPSASVLSQSVFERTQNQGIQSLFGRGGPLQGGQSYYSDQVTRFYNALLYADLIDGIHFADKDEQTALQLLASLAQESPENGVFAFYYAYILSQQGRDLNSQKQWLLQAIEAPYFDSFMKEKVTEVSQELTRNVTLWLAVNQVLSQIPIPKFPKPSFLKSVFANPTAEEARLLSEFAMRVNRSKASLKIEAFTAKKIYDFFHQDAGLGEAEPPLQGLKVAPGDLVDNDAGDAEAAFTALKFKPCDRSLLDAQFRRAQADQMLTPDF